MKIILLPPQPGKDAAALQNKPAGLHTANTESQSGFVWEGP